jgi:hypothetical protein
MYYRGGGFDIIFLIGYKIYSVSFYLLIRQNRVKTDFSKLAGSKFLD